VRTLRAGPILASWAVLDASSARMPRGPSARLYGPLGRARILAAAGKLESALVAAERADVDDAERAVIVREFKCRLATQQAAVGDIDGAIRLAVECKPDGGAAAGKIASEVMARVEPASRDTAIKRLETLHEAYPAEGGVSVALARLLNQRAVTAQRNDAPIRSYISDMERAGRLDQDSIQIRSNLAQTYFGRAAEVWERYPDQAMGDLRKAVATDPNSGELRSAGSQLALACASKHMERRSRREARVCLEYAVQLDPSNTEAFRAAMMLR
jgi:tetratricopeptide (TPR) repeat protein